VEGAPAATGAEASHPEFPHTPQHGEGICVLTFRISFAQYVTVWQRQWLPAWELGRINAKRGCEKSFSYLIVHKSKLFAPSKERRYSFLFSPEWANFLLV
jgi:hypothetical protein